MKVKCKRCEHEWNYNGKLLKIKSNYPKYAQCPNCKTSVKIEVKKK